MTSPIYPPAAPTVPTYPALGSASFNQEAYAYGTAMPAVSTAMGSLANATYTNAVAASESAFAAQTSETTATSAAAAASATVGATKWVSGTYAQGAVVWSPANGMLYRRKTAGSSSTDPSSGNSGWWLIGAPFAAPILLIAGNTAAQTGTHYIFTASLTLTLPASPVVRDMVQITDLSASNTAVINPNGALIRGNSGNLVINIPNARFELVYSGATKGWV